MNKSTRWLSLTILCCIVAATGRAGEARPSASPEKLSKHLQETAARGGMVDVIVQYRNTPTEAHHRRMAARGGILRHSLDIIKAAHYQIPASAVRDLASDPEIAYVTVDHPVQAHVTGLLDQASATIGANLAYQFSVDGTGVGIAVIDSGIGNHDDLSNKVVFSQNVAQVSTVVAQDQVKVAQDQVRVNADSAVITADNTALATASASVAADTLIYSAAVAAQAAHPNNQQYQQATQTAQRTLQSDQNVAQQTGNQLQNDQNHLQNDQQHLSQDQEKVVVDTLAAGGGADDQFGHGTHVAGILAGSGKDSTGNQFTRTFKGVAPGVSLINLKVLDQNGSGTDSLVIEAIQTAIALKSQYNIRVINLSLGRPVYESYTVDPLCQAVEQAWNAGIVVVAAAGNYGRNNPTTTYGYGTITAPGNDPYVITVGAMNDMGTATRTDDVITTYSSKGPTAFDMVAKPDIVAPGNMIDSTLAPGSQFTHNYPTTDIPMYDYQVNGNQNASNQYLQLSGTSMATPFVSAAAALLLQQNPSLTPDQVKARLMLTATKTFPATSSYTDPLTGITYKEQYDIFTVGAGYLNVDAALASTVVAPAFQSAMSPGVMIAATTTGNTAALVTGQHVVWGSNIVWGANTVWGSNVVWGANTVWGSNVVWGASNLFLNALNAVGGASSVASSSVVWGANIVWGAEVVAGAGVENTAMTIVTGGDQ